MAQQTINIGSAANDETGDPLRTAFDKSNDNFDELYTASALRRRYLTGTKTWDAGSIADGAMTSTTVTVTGAILGYMALACLSVAVPVGAVLAAQVTATDTVTVTLINHTGSVLDLASATLRADVLY